MRRDLRRSSPTRDLVELHRPEGASVLVFAKKPLLIHRRVVRYGDGEPEAAGDAVGIVMVWPACNLRPSSMWLAFCKSSTVTLHIFAMDVSVSPRATVCVLPSTGNAMQMLRQRQRLLGRVQLLRSLHLAEHARVVAPV